MSTVLHVLELAILRGASLLVPHPEREEWYREWASELWHVRQSCTEQHLATWIAERKIISFCAGSFQDAVCIQRHGLRAPAAPRHGSAVQCLVWLSTAVALCAIVAHVLPGVRNEQDAARARLRSDAILIQAGAFTGTTKPSISFTQYETWKLRRQRFFKDLAFYRVVRDSAESAGERDTWSVAYGTKNLFRVLGFEGNIQSAEVRPREAQAWLSSAVWRRDFASDPGVVGKFVAIKNQEIRIAGIAPAGTLLLPDHADIWVLGTGSSVVDNPSSPMGYVVGLLSPIGRSQMTDSTIQIWSSEPDGEQVEYHGTAFEPSDGPAGIFEFALLLALLALPAITTVFRSESDFESHQPSLKSRAKRVLFVLTKMSLIVAAGYFAALDVAYWGISQYSSTAEFLQFVASFNFCLFGLQWALVDQSRRCPVCLRRVTHPAQVGSASRTFLAWNGTEMICTGGHALLHVPSLPTSWFSRERWMYLDPSWKFLFADGGGG
ncbi:MAG: ABC transporter permease [Acidobacteriota bacterium]